ncbi:MAG: HAD hydrolase-like protein [Thermoanaerobaculia bacterium]
MTRALLVDLGKVLVAFDHQVTCDRLAEATGVPAGRLRPVLFGDLEAEFDRGRLGPAAFFRACEERAGLPRLPDGLWESAWRDIFHPLPDAIAALARVDRKVRRVLVSNTNELHWEGVLRVFDPRGLLDDVVLSFRVGAVKPEPAFWEAALAAAGCAAGECLYADDRAELVASAAARGIPGFVVAGPGSFADGLARCGLTGELSPAAGNSGSLPNVRLS